jgi:ABC-type arginine transport system ATPase subunit
VFPAFSHIYIHTYQNFEFFPQFTVVGYLTLAQVRALGFSKEEAYKTADALLDRGGLFAYADKFTCELSSSQQHRVAIFISKTAPQVLGSGEQS